MSERIFSHITLGTRDLERAKGFYDAVMPVLGLVRHSTGDTFIGYGHAEDAKLGVNSLWVLLPQNGLAATSGNGTNVAFLAPSHEVVHKFHELALLQGGTNDGDPGLRSAVHPSFYAAYVRDLDGNKLVVVCHGEAPSA